MTQAPRLRLALLTWLALIASLHVSPQQPVVVVEASVPAIGDSVQPGKLAGSGSAQPDESKQDTEQLMEETQALVKDQLSSDLSTALNEIATQEDTSIEEKMAELESLGLIMEKSSLTDSLEQSTAEPQPVPEPTMVPEQVEVPGDVQIPQATGSLASEANATSGAGARTEAEAGTKRGLFNKVQDIVGRLRQKLVLLGGYLARRFHELKPMLFGKSLRNRIKSGTKELKMKLPRWPDFVSFKARFHKFYRSPREELFRQMVYVRTQAVVMVQHMRCILGLDRFFLKATKYSDWTEQEYAEKMGNKAVENQQEHLPPYPKKELDRLRQLPGANGAHSKVHHQHKRSADEQQLKLATGLEPSDEEEYDPAEMDAVEVFDLSRDNSYSDSEEEEEYEEDEDEDISDIEMEDTDDDVPISKMTPSGTTDHTHSEQEDPDELAIQLEEMLDEVVADDSDFEPIDLRQTKCLGPVDDQDICGACYAYVANAAAEYYHCMDEGGKFFKLNPRFATDCGSYFDHNLIGCQGGMLSKALRFMGHCGGYPAVVYEIFRAGRPSGYHSDQCPFPGPQGQTQEEKRRSMADLGRVRVKTMEGATFYMLDKADWHTHLFGVGPVYINFKVPRNFKEFGGGVYDGTDNDNDFAGMHSMMIIGHIKDEDDPSKGYWLVRNSHGPLWGEQGHMRLSDLGADRQVILSIGMKTRAMDSPVNSRNEKLYRLYRR